MISAARKIEPSLVIQESGTVTGEKNAEFVVEVGSGRVSAKRATSCLVAPAEGDKVLVAIEQSGRAYVLAVLERPEEKTKTTISVPGDLEIMAPSGTCSIAGQEGVRVASCGEVKIAANELTVHALNSNVVTERLSFAAKWMLGELGKLRTVAESIDSVVGRISERVDRSYRTVKEIDQVRAHQMDYTADEQIRMHAKNTIVTSDNLVKVDGDQIHFG